MSPHTILQAQEDHAVSPPQCRGSEEDLEHEALIGTEISDSSINDVPTITIQGETPFEDDGDEVVAHKIVATEVVPDPVSTHVPEPILQNAVVVLDPRLDSCAEIITSANKRGLFVTAVVSDPNTSGKNVNYFPTAESLLEIGVHQVYEPPLGGIFNVCECANHLKTIESQQNLRFLGVIPLREASVSYSDVLGALLGIAAHNDLGLASARRDKALMKQAVANAGLRVAKYARLTAPDGSDVAAAIEDLELEFPVVVKTPRGMSTLDVYICDTLEEAVKRSAQIVTSICPDGVKAHFSLLEEFLGGDEFAVNLVATPTSPRGMQVTDVWLYNKVLSDGTNVNRWQEMVDPHSKKHASLVRYAEGVCRAVGIKYGLAHVEVKAKYDASKRRYVDPAMIEVGARLAGGRKNIMAQATVPGWLPFDAMVDAHCSFPIRVPHSFSPHRHARHVYIPSNEEGRLVSMSGDNFERFETYHSHMMLVKPGDMVKRAQDIYSFAGFVWLVGPFDKVAEECERARKEFSVVVE